MPVPSSIPFSSVVFGDRARTNYANIDLLATSIKQVGLQCPVILSPLSGETFLLEDGGRRYRALESLGTRELFHGSTSLVGQPGFVLKSEVSTKEGSLLTELIANLHREQLDWRDELKILVQAWRLRKREADLAGEELYYATFGKLVGNYSHTDINAAVRIYDDYVASPEKYAACTSIVQAYQTVFRSTLKALEQEAASRVLKPTPTAKVFSPTDSFPSDSEAPASVVFDFSSRFKLCNSLDYMSSPDCPVFDHIVCDPDYAISEERLSANNDNAHLGIAQDSVAESLVDLKTFISLAFNRCSGFCIFWYDLEHHEKLAAYAAVVGWRVQRWPFIWHKVGFGSNAAPQHNFTKSFEPAMILRHPSSTLVSAAPSAVFAHPAGNASVAFGHPFAKPVEVWTKLFSAIAHPGQTVFDPFMGSGSSVIAARAFGLDAFGCELNPDHFNRAILNLRAATL